MAVAVTDARAPPVDLAWQPSTPAVTSVASAEVLQFEAIGE
jgi:hypothetical protein